MTDDKMTQSAINTIRTLSGRTNIKRVMAKTGVIETVFKSACN